VLYTTFGSEENTGAFGTLTERASEQVAKVAKVCVGENMHFAVLV